MTPARLSRFARSEPAILRGFHRSVTSLGAAGDGSGVPPVMQKPLGFAYARPLGPSARPIAVSDRGYSVGQTTLPTRMGAHDRTC